MSDDRRSVFPLRFRRPALRRLVREIAERENVTQTEFIERAIEHEVVIRGELMARDLARSAKALAEATDDELEAIVAASVEDFAQGESQADPLAGRRISGERRGSNEEGSETPLDAVSAFRGTSP